MPLFRNFNGLSPLTFSFKASIMSTMANVLSTAKRVQIVSALIEGMGVRATARMVDVSKDTVSKLSLELGEACIRYMDETLVNLPCKRLQVDEMWGFCYAKAKNVPAAKKGEFGYGDVWAFTGVCADTKLIPPSSSGSRDLGCATEFMQDLAGRLANRVQLTTDGHKMYLGAVERCLRRRGRFRAAPQGLQCLDRPDRRRATARRSAPAVKSGW